MDLKSIVLGTALMGIGVGASYAIWKNTEANTHTEEIIKYIVTTGIGLAGIGFGGRLAVRHGIYGKSQRQNPPNHPRNPPRKRKYVETRTDEYGRQYKIEREETIE